ncbi:MAG: glutamate--cysteine ligase [Gallionellales bacterium RIFCSPLOWO2_02_FULL_57_47]|nr:MAG: glutamate--cysteine ligase [Gallionellales bacterium RIFCSPLOWO2_02_FULL_57_47]OGT11742.1 MAG: glutamate--cysteine ligase [Gallionellales bacterium RIFCSPHIGHO2_02_FULL_57_16]
MVPHLTTALTGQLLDLERRLLNSMPTIEHWLRTQWLDHAAPFYASVDLRNSGFKLAPVDTNLFPGGFNNLNPDFLPLCVQAMQSAVEKICPEARGVLLIPESHTRNLFYLQNVAQIVKILKQAGMRVRVGSLLPEITAATAFQLPGGNALTLEPLVRRGNRLGLDGFDPCVVLLNNDLSGGVPDILKGLEQAVFPPLSAGWHTRRKSRHFSAYDRVANEFAQLIGIDPWLIDPYFAVCNKVNFHERVGEECLAAHVDDVLNMIRVKYAEYGVKNDPFVIVKADAGTYGMGIMTVKDASEITGLNRKQRNKMAVVKEGMEVSDVLVQEGVYTFEHINDAVAEPVVYMVDHYVVGGFYRVHTERGIDENLNAPGMFFEPLAFEACCTLPNPDCEPDDTPNRFYAYGVVARLALLAASLEIEDR